MTSKPIVIGVRGEYIYFDRIWDDKKRGYRKVLTINPITKRKRYLKEHRLLFELYHKCCLLDYADVHHKNGNGFDNSRKNLEGMTHINHTILHHPRVDRSDRHCILCGSSKTSLNQLGSARWCKYNDGYVCHTCYERIRRSRNERKSTNFNLCYW